ncbi:hypothetical protein ACH5A7_20925 [Streptomyces sp. NPDC018955]|uniref:hypothetical protein n=1 Tax=Streptomyces sp. NPDC018955 TaxID=3365055 RepID=UPI0037A0D12B
MGLFSRKAAEAIDNTAAALHKVAGDKGDQVATTVLGPIRQRLDHDCTRCEKGNCNRP